MVICLELGADLHMAQLMPLPLTVSCFSKIQTGFTFLVPAHPGSAGKRAVKWVYVCVCNVSNGWLGSRVVSMLDSGAEGPGFKLQLRRCRVTVLGKLFTPIVPLFRRFVVIKWQAGQNIGDLALLSPSIPSSSLSLHSLFPLPPLEVGSLTSDGIKFTNFCEN